MRDVSIRISQLLSACTTSQRAYLTALSAYRHSLKAILEREAAIRTVIRDREILIGRVVKLGNKKPGDSALASHEAKVEDAQRELAACENYLQGEEEALNSVKRRTFRESLALRMKAMGELGRVMEESAVEAMELLAGVGLEDHYVAQDFAAGGHEREDSLTPSNSASQALSRSSSFSSLSAPLPTRERASAPSPPPLQQPPQQPRALSPPPAAPRPAPVPRPRLTVPTAPRPISAFVPSSDAIPGQPTFEIPKAPTHVMQRAEAVDSSDEEEEYPLEKPPSPAPRAGGGAGGGGGGRLRRPRAQSDTSSMHGRAERRTSFFGGIANLFKSSKDKRRERSTDSPSSANDRASWEPTRTDKASNRARQPTYHGSSNLHEDDTSDDEGMPKNLIRVVNDPKKRRKAASDVGASKSAPTPAPAAVASGGKLEKKGKPRAKAASDLGVHPSIMPEPPTQPRRRKVSTTTAAPAPSAPALARSTSVATTARSTSAATARQSQGLSRSNTTTSARTTETNGTVKRKKKRAVPVEIPIPTAADLSSSLPSAIRNSFPAAPGSPSLPSPPGSPRIIEPTPSPHETREPKQRLPKSLGENSKRAKRESALLGSADWVSHPPGTQPPSAQPTPPKVPHTHHPRPLSSAPATNGEQQHPESLMAIVERDSAAAPSRSYGPSSSPIVARTLSPDYSTNLHKRKSVRLADGPSPEPHGSPPSSVRSDSLAPPAKGILVNHHPSPSSNGGGVDTAWSRRREGEGDSSDEESIDGEYALAKKALVRQTKKLEGAVGGKPDKGKGRMVDVEA
ncbi:hypothetical protein RQP46_004350 [Phenoliferia psychrophenolica]